MFRARGWIQGMSLEDLNACRVPFLQLEMRAREVRTILLN